MNLTSVHDHLMSNSFDQFYLFSFMSRLICLLLSSSLPGFAQLEPFYDMALPAGSSSQAPDLEARGASPIDFLGGTLLSADVNGDGVADLISASSMGPAERSGAGQVRIWFGSELVGGIKDAAGNGAPPDVTIIGEATNDALTATGLLFARDLNGDGIDDLLLGAPFNDGLNGGATSCGGVYVVFGRHSSQSFPVLIDLKKKNNGTTITDGADVSIYGIQSNAATGNYGIGLWMDTADLNDDETTDLILGFSGVEYSRGRVYIVMGRKGPASFPPVIDLWKLNSPTVTDGADVQLRPPSTDFHLSFPKSIGTGDVDGDGITDLVIGAPLGPRMDGTRPSSGVHYVIKGRASFPSIISLSKQNGAGTTDGADVTILGANEGDGRNGRTILSPTLKVDDLNGDGRADILMSAPFANGPDEARASAGEVSIVFGKSLLPPLVDLALLNGPGISNGADAVIHGPANGRYIASNGGLATGDINGDGLGDIFIGDDSSDGPDDTRLDAGAIYVILGRAGNTPFHPRIDLANRNGPGISNGSDFVIHGASANDQIPGSYKLQTGDLNGDGLDDLIYPVPYGKGPNDSREAAGEIHVIFGKTEAFPSVIDLASGLPGQPDLTIWGAAGDRIGFYEGLTLGDINGDGHRDLIFSAPFSSPGGKTNAGKTFAIFGGRNGRRIPVPAISDQGSGGKQLQYSGTSGLRYEVQRSTDLEEWFKIGEATADSEGHVQFTDQTPPAGAVFYRIHRP